MALFDRLLEPIAKRSASRVLTGLSDIYKADSQALVTPSSKPGVLRYTFDPVYINTSYYNKKKPDSTITFDVLRNFSLKYEIVRGCINLRKRQLSGMEWDVVTAETSDTNSYDNDILRAKEFINNLGGVVDPKTGDIRGGSYRKFMNMIIEDLLSLDAVALYNVRANDSSLLTLLPVDGSTIRLLIGDQGQSPMPPEIAYKQVIRGTVVAELTTDDLRYNMMNPRTNSPYGLSPLESLMITVSSALKSGLYNLSYLTDGNIPEGLVEAPTNWTPTQIREFEKNWNAAMAGDDGATRKLHWLPNESKYMPTKKPTDMAFEMFGLWLMQLTCVVFDVMPIDLGFPPKGVGLGGKGFADNQAKTGNDKGLLPIANLIEEVFDEIIQVDLGLPHLKFSFTGLDSENLREKADTNQVLIFSGQRTPNEIRTDDGLEPIEGGDALVLGPGSFVPLNKVAADMFNMGTEDPTQAGRKGRGGGAEGEAADTRAEEADAKAKKPQFDDDGSAGDNDGDIDMSRKTDKAFIQLVTELRTLRKYTRNRFARGRGMKPFESKVLPTEALKEINLRLSKSRTFEEADAVIKEYRQDYQIEFLANVNRLRSSLQEIVGDEQSEPAAQLTR